MGSWDNACFPRCQMYHNQTYHIPKFSRPDIEENFETVLKNLKGSKSYSKCYPTSSRKSSHMSEIKYHTPFYCDSTSPWRKTWDTRIILFGTTSWRVNLLNQLPDTNNNTTTEYPQGNTPPNRQDVSLRVSPVKFPPCGGHTTNFLTPSSKGVSASM